MRRNWFPVDAARTRKTSIIFYSSRSDSSATTYRRRNLFQIFFECDTHAVTADRLRSSTVAGFSWRPCPSRGSESDPLVCEESRGNSCRSQPDTAVLSRGWQAIQWSYNRMSKAYCRDVINDQVDSTRGPVRGLDQSPCHGAGHTGGARPQEERPAPLCRPHNQ